jgi:hypothetical protein
VYEKHFVISFKSGIEIEVWKTDYRIDPFYLAKGN